MKLHTRLVVVSKDLVFPDKVIPSDGMVSDFESAPFIIETDNATYVMDRGYPSKANLEDWLSRDISFVVRITKSLRLYTLETYTPTHSSVVRDEKVNFGISDVPVRYIEFMDEKGRIYRILTTRFDLSDQEILEIYKNRWLIELFFRWIKGHLKLTKIWSTKPQGIWNQVFLALIALGVSLIMKIRMNASRTAWQFFRVLQTCLYLPVQEMLREVHRKRKPSKGRRKVARSLPPAPVSLGGIALKKNKKSKR